VPVYDDQDIRSEEDNEQNRFDREFKDITDHYHEGGGARDSRPDLRTQEGLAGSGARDLAKQQRDQNKREAKHAAALPASDLRAKENRGGDGPGFWSKAATSPTGFAAKLGNFFWGSRRRKNATVAGSVLTVVIGGIGLYGTFSLSGFEFIQMAHDLEQIHFVTNQDQGNDRSLKLLRYIRYAQQHRLERTSLGYIGNQMADRVEAKFNAMGLESSYSKIFGLKQGWIIDKSAPQYKNKSPQQIEEYVHETYGPNVQVEFDAGGVKGRVMIVQPSGYTEALKFNYTVLQEAGDNKVSSIISARIMGERDGVTWHPLRKLDSRLFKYLDQKIAEWTKEENADISEGDTSATLSTQEETKQNAGQGTKQRAASTKAGADQTIQEGQTAGQAADAGNTGPLSALQGHIATKIALGGTLAVGIACIARGLASDAGNIKQAQVALPLTRIGMRAISEGHQIQYGKIGIDPQQMQLDAKRFYDPTTKTTWFDSQSLLAGLGQGMTGVPASPTLQNLGKGTPFDFLLTGSLGSALAPVCSAAGQGIITVLSFLGGPISAAASLITGAVFGPPIISAIAHWLAGDAANKNAQGAAYGTNADYGAFLGSRDQNISQALPAISKAAHGQLSSIEQQQSKDEFDQHNLAYRLFSPTDSRSFLASIINHESPTLGANISNIMFGLIDIGHSVLGTFSSIFASATAHADTTYDYGGLAYHAMSIADMNSALVENPYQSADENVAGLLSGPNGSTYIKWAQECFGDTIYQTAGPGGPSGPKLWDVQYGTSALNTLTPQYKAIEQNPCSNTSDTNWLRILFYIFDTSQIKSLNCFMGGDSSSTQSCSDMGMINA
jgi:hypothetical protein